MGFFVEIRDYSPKKILKIEKNFVTFEIRETCTGEFFYKMVILDIVEIKLLLNHNKQKIIMR